MDSAPDRWGRKLMQRREAYRARREGESPRILMESDYLLGVHDDARMGALRFKTDPDGHFLNDDQAMAAPPWARLRELEEASRHVDDDSTDSNVKKWLAMLIAPARRWAELDRKPAFLLRTGRSGSPSSPATRIPRIRPHGNTPSCGWRAMQG